MPLVLDGTNGVSGVDGTASNPAIEGTDSNTGIFYPAADTVAIGTGGTERVRVDSVGNTGFGVTPSAWGASFKAIQLANGVSYASTNDPSLQITQNGYYDGTNWRFIANGYATNYQHSSGQHIWRVSSASGTAGNAITFTQAMTLTASGNFSLGTTTEAGRAYILGDGTNVAFRVAANTSTSTVYCSIMRHENTTAGAYIQFVTNDNVETGRIYDSAGTMQYASSSDARLKTNVQPMQNSLQSVLALNPCTFDMRRGEDIFIPSAGLIAQEVHEVYPFVVGVGGDDENTNPWSVDYGKLTPLLVAAIKELNAKVEALEAQLKGNA